MTKRLTSKFKVYKQFGVQLWDKFKLIPTKKRTRGAKPNLVENANKYAGIHGYAVKWTEKQIFKKFYGNVSEKQLKKYIRRSKSTKDPMSAFIQQVESRLDVIIYRMFFADTVFSARQLISHGHISVNSRIITKPSYAVRPGDVIAPALPVGLTKTAGSGVDQQNSELTASKAKSAILILENIVRRMIMILKLNIKSITHPFDISTVNLRTLRGQQENTQSSSIAIKRGADSIKYLKLLKMCSNLAVVDSSVKISDAQQQDGQSQSQSPSKTRTGRVGQSPATHQQSQLKNGNTVNPSILKWSPNTAKSKHEPQQAKNLRPITNQKSGAVLQFTPYIKINFSLLTGVYLRLPEIADVKYPKRLKFNLNRILNFYK